MPPHKKMHRTNNHWGLILAAGDGTRLQGYVKRLKGRQLPKQYVNFIGRRSMLEHTFARVEKLIPPAKIFTIVAKHHLQHREVRRQLTSCDRGTVIVQPANKETGPGILLPLMYLYKRCPGAIVSVFPSDHFILEEDRFMDYVDLAAKAVASNPSDIVLLATEAQGPEVEYGYIAPHDSSSELRLYGTRPVARFVEKPAKAVADHLIESGGLWNTMVMVFKVKTVLEMFEQIHPVVFRQFCQILDAIGTSHEQETIDQVYQNLTPMNFSKGFLEQLSALYPRAIHVMPVLQVFWSDWGSRQRILEARQVLKRAGRGKPQPKALSDEPDERTAGTTVCA